MQRYFMKSPLGLPWSPHGRTAGLRFDGCRCRIHARMVDNMASHRSARVGARKESIVSDLTFMLAFMGSIVALALPIVVIVRLLLVDGADGITSLFLARPWDE